MVATTSFADACIPAGLAPNATFAGCSGMPMAELWGLRFGNALGGQAQRVCLDGIRLIANGA